MGFYLKLHKLLIADELVVLLFYKLEVASCHIPNLLLKVNFLLLHFFDCDALLDHILLNFILCVLGRSLYLVKKSSECIHFSH